MPYNPPWRELEFALNEIAGATLLQEQGFPGFDRETAGAILEAGGRLARDVLAPLNRPGDEAGARFENGHVLSAPGFAPAYRAFAEGGWNALAADPTYGGQGLPKVLALAMFEMVHSANMAFGLCPLLTQGAIEALSAHGTERQKKLYLPQLVSGAWTGTMNLTEPQAGSDLAALRMRAEPDGNAFRLSGQKIFITWGDHDMTENIVHLVLARLPDAPAGTKGISLFVATKRLVHDDGALGAPNNLGAAGIEHKLGIHASPTCTMQFDGAQAELVGTVNQGLAHMFTMMNAARLQIGVQGVAIAERAYQQALGFALERRQGRSAWTGAYPAPLFDLPDVRRMLMLMKARIEAARGLCFATAVAADLALTAKTDEQRRTAKLREELFTPIAKAWSTDMGVDIASIALQVHGGMGFIEETGAAQHYRDARIGPIYEGTNGIQAIDLVGRKLGLEGGQAVRDLLADISQTIALLRAAQSDWLVSIADRLDAAVSAVRGTSDWLSERLGHAQPDALAGAVPYLKLMGDTIGGWMLAKGALAAAQHLARDGKDDDSWWRTRIGLARLFADHILAQAPGLAVAVTATASDIFSATAEALGAQ